MIIPQKPLPGSPLGFWVLRRGFPNQFQCVSELSKLARLATGWLYLQHPILNPSSRKISSGICGQHKSQQLGNLYFISVLPLLCIIFNTFKGPQNPSPLSPSSVSFANYSLFTLCGIIKINMLRDIKSQRDYTTVIKK